jgi:hypothetical protein
VQNIAESLCQMRRHDIIFSIMVISVSFSSVSGDTDEVKDTCFVCANNTYCSGRNITDCPMHSQSNEGSTDVTDCVCKPGYFGSNGDECMECTTDYVCIGGNSHVECPYGSESPPGSNSTLACVCQAGMVAGVSGCVQCATGFFCDKGQETKCPGNSFSPPGSTNISACVCLAGYISRDGYLTDQNKVCTSCAPGTYSASPGSRACTRCPSDTYSTSIAATSTDTCKSCPYNTYSDFGTSNVSDCTCPPGYYRHLKSGCVGCAAGTYKDQLGNMSCTYCGIDEYSNKTRATSADTCIACPANTGAAAGSNNITLCTCSVGYTKNNEMRCIACGRGTYKNVSGDSSCILCDPDTYSTKVAATSADTCNVCMRETVSERGSTSESDCKCPAGYIGNFNDGCRPLRPSSVAKMVFTIVLDMTIAEFTLNKQQELIGMLASFFQIEISAISITGISIPAFDHPTRFRRLLSDNTEAEVTMDVREDESEDAQENIDNGSMNSHLRSNGYYAQNATSPSVSYVDIPKRRLSVNENRLISMMKNCPCAH